MRKLQLILILIIISIVNISCKNNDEETGDTFPEFLHAVWQDEEFDDGDEIGIYFTEKKIFSWDYDGDSFDEGDDCYFVFEIGEIISYTGDKYRFKVNDLFSDEEEEITVIIKVNGNTMTISDPDEDEDSTPYSKDSRDILDLEPKCSESFKTLANPDGKKRAQNIFSFN
ncbi:MAG: hypothetical protein RI564_07765 [Gracilimonas sp.]|jgi:hypothetical protein|nr:hypothetical protein [Gracilimonas sp.]